MGKTQSNLERLYGAVSAQFDIGTFEEFRAKMNTPEDRRRFYDAVDAKGFDLGNYDEYERRLGGVQGVSAQGSAGTSETSGLPSSSSEEPSLDTPSPEQIGQAATDFEAQQIQNVGNQYRDRYVPQDSTVLGGVNIGGEPSVAILDPNAPEGVSNVIPPVDVVASDTMTFQTSVRNTFDNLVNQIKGIDDRLSLVAAESWERLLGKELAASWYEYDGRDINQVKMDAYAELERLESEMKQTQSVSGAIASGDPVAILAASINALSALGGTALASITTGGVGLYTEMMGSAIYDFNKTKAEELGLTVEELYEQGKAEFATPAAIGAIGGALERIGFRGAQRAFLSQINSQAGRRLLKAGLGANQEGMTEWLQTGLEAVNERMAEGDANTFDISSVFADALFSEEGLEAYLMGAVGSASASGLGRMGGTISSRVANRDLADNINQGFDTLASIEQDLSNPEISPSTQAVLRGQQDAIVSEISDNIIESTQQEDTLPTESKNEVEGLLSRLEELQAAIQDPNVSETTKESLRTQAEQVSGEIDAIISTSQESSAETSVSQEPVDIQETPAQDLSELQAEYDALGRDLQEGRITQEEFDASADLLYGSILLRRDADALEAQMFEERAAQRQIEVDAAISEFQRNNPDIEVDLFEDLPDSVVRTFERVERGIPTDPVALEEASSWLYDKYQSVLDERNNPERRHTIEQLNSIANQIGEDITILENYRYEQQNETESVQPETEASNIPSQPEQEAERVEATGQQESEVTTEAETSPVRDDLSSDEALGQLTAEVSSEAPVETVSDGGVVSGVEQEAAPVSVDDVQSEQEQSEVSLPVAERPVRITDDMPPKQPENARVKSLLRMLPRQDTAEMMGPANVEYRRDVIEAITGKRPAKKDAGITNVRRAIADYLGIDLENTSGVNFSDMVRNWANSPDSSTKKSSRPSRQANRYVNSDVSDSVASNPEEVTREFAERTDDPDLIADAYSHVTPREPDYIEEGIANYLGGGRINRRDFNSFGDRNRASQPLSSRWLDASNSQLGLDVMAQELSDQLGVEVTEQDFIDFVEKYRGKNDFEQSRKSAEQEILEDRYRELTGRNLTPRVAESARRRLDAEITDRDLLESSPVFRELGITYEDVLDYEEFHRQSDQGGAENVPSQESVGSTAVADGGARPQGAKAKAKTPKTLLKGIADRLSKTGLAKSVKMMTSEEIVADLTGRSNVQFQTDPAELADIEAKAKSDGTWMKAPNGKPTNLNEKQWTLVRTKAFKDWFGDWENDPANASKVIDENGEPLVVYHGTDAHIDVFDLKKIVRAGEEVHKFITNPEMASVYGKNVIAAFLSIKDSVVGSKFNERRGLAKFHIDKSFNDARLDLIYNSKRASESQGGVAYGVLSNDLKQKGDVYFVHDSNQIKSATDNVGTFDPSNPDIRFQASAWHGSPHVTQPQKGEDINGYVDADGNIVINSDTAGLDTPIHEFAHIWERTIETQNPFLHQRGMELIQTEEGKPYVDHVKKTQPSLTGQALYKEALAQAIGDRGARLIESQKNSSIKQWLKDAWDFIAKMVGLSEMSMSDISTLTLNEFADAAAVDLLSGKQFARLENGDTVAKTTAASESRMDDKDKFMSDFMTRMRKRNGINYQGQVDGSLSDGDFSELITFFNYGTEKGLINGLSDARAAAESMGINSPGQVERAYKISQIRAKSATGFKVSEVSEERIANADFNKVSDREYLAIGKDMVDSGLVKPYDLVNSILTDPRALQPEEVAAMQYYRTQIESDIYDLQKLVDSGSESEVSSFNFNGARGYDGIAAKMEVINQSLFDLDMAILATASQQSAAFRLRSVMADRDFNIVTYLAELKARGYVDPKLEAKLKKLSNELNSVRAKLKRKSKEAEALAEQISQGNIVQEGTQPVRQTRTVRHKKETVEAVNRVLDSLDLDSFALPGMSFQANSTLRFQVNPNPAVSEAVRSAVEKMKLDVSEGRSSLSDALEAAVESVNSVVGEGNWDSVKFRSAVANGLVQNSIPVKVRKPYVNSDGVLIIPGEYLKSLVREGVDTIEKMVSAASAELDGQFSEYDIRNAISGYGRQSASHRTDLDRKISKAKRIANLLSQIEDLETKGERVRTAKQKHDNDTRINNLKDTVRQLEYDLEMTPEERAQYAEQRYNEQRQRYLRNYIYQVQERIDNKDFAPVKHRNRYEDDAETTALRKEAESIKNEFKKEKYRHELENRTPSEKFRALAYDILFNITRGLSAGADASAIGVQGAIYTFARPKDAYKIFAGSMKGTFSEQEYQDYFTEMQSDPFYEMARNAGLNLQLPNFYQSVQEEQYKGQLPELMWNKIINDPAAFMVSKFTRKPDSEIRDALYDKANPFTLGDRNYSLVLSKMRFDMFKEFMANQINKRGVNTEMDTDTIKQVAEIVNTITMASKVPGLQGKLGNDIVSAIMFSARKFIATWKILGAWAPLLMGSSRNTQLFYDSYGGVIGKGLGTMFAMAAIPTAIASWMRFDDDEDDEEPYFYNPYFLDPRHSDFMKLKMGNTRVSLFQGIDGNVIWATRFVTGEYMTSSSRQVRPLNGEQFNKTRLSLTWDYISNKFAPTAGSAVRLLGGDRDRIEGMERFRESLAPMWATGIWEQYQDTGNVAETSALGILGMFGLAYNNYGGAEFASKRGTDNKKAVEIFERSGLSAYDPGRNQRTYFDGEKMSSVSGSLYSDSYLPAYQKYMTEAVLSNEARFSKNVHWEHKEGLIKSMKRDAYKYAEIESSGIYARAGFDKFSIDGVQYKLLESQYSDKAKHIKNYMDKLYKRDIREAKTSVRAKMRSEGIKATPAYIEMQEKLYLYNKASAYANQMLYNDMRRGKMKLFKSTEVTVDTVLDEE